jgi:Mn2+/Fe2+ NRAMP family transporter
MAGGKTFWKALGPGLLWAGAAVGVSHLVQSTRAGANYGFALLAIILVANLVKYPAFSFGPRYAAATGTSLLEGYRRRGVFALVLYALLTLGTMFTIQAAVTIVTGALGAAVLGWKTAWLGISPVFWLSIALTVVCAGLLLIGHYRWLDKIVKVVVVVLTLSTFTATLLVLPKIPWGEMSFLPPRDLWSNLWLAALIGWMPSHAPSVRESLLDFRIGYLGTVLLSLCFLTLGAGVMFTAGRKFDAPAASFASQVVNLYVSNLGDWSKPLIGLSALTVMFSTTLTVIDGFPRAIACLVARFRGPEIPDRPEPLSRVVYWTALVVLGVGALLVIRYAGDRFKTLIDFATTLSFLTAPALAWLNHRTMFGAEVPPEHQPGPRMRLYSWIGIAFSAAFALFFLYVRFC